MTNESLKQKIDFAFTQNPAFGNQQRLVNKALQEFREEIDNYPILDLKNVVTPEARNAVQEFQTIVLALLGTKDNL